MQVTSLTSAKCAINLCVHVVHLTDDPQVQSRVGALRVHHLIYSQVFQRGAQTISWLCRGQITRLVGSPRIVPVKWKGVEGMFRVVKGMFQWTEAALYIAYIKVLYI